MQNLQIYKVKLNQSILEKLTPKEAEVVKLKFQDGVNFGVLDNKGKKDLAIVLNRLCYFVGIKEPLSVENIKMLINYLSRYHANFNTLELENAIMMASSGHFGICEHFQSFSSIYISKVLNLYDSFRAQSIFKYTEELNKKSDIERSQEKQQNYDRIKGFTEVVLSEYDYFIKSKQEDFNTDLFILGNTRAMICLELGNKLGLFLDFKKQKETALEFFERIFKPLQTKPIEQARQNIIDWIQKHAKK